MGASRCCLVVRACLAASRGDDAWAYDFYHVEPAYHCMTDSSSERLAVDYLIRWGGGLGWRVVGLETGRRGRGQRDACVRQRVTWGEILAVGYLIRRGRKRAVSSLVKMNLRDR